MKSKKQARIWARLCALALIAVMLLTSAYAGGVIPPAEAEAASAAAEGKNTALAAETVDSESPEESLGEPAHRKYIKDNGDGTYQLSLDVTGKTMTQTETEQRPVDVILVVDKSGSMKNKIEEGREQPTRLAVIQNLVKNMATELLPTGTQNRMSVVTFSSATTSGNEDDDSYVQTKYKYKDAQTKQGWISSEASIHNAIDNITPSGGTNWEAGLYEANKLISSRREDALTFVVFLSDGNPTFRYTNSDWSNGRYSGAGYTQGTGNSDPNSNNYNHALIEAEKIPNDVKFFSVSIGGDADKMQNFANDLKQEGKDATYYDGKDATSLENAFDNIIETITTSGYTNVTITDTLSEYAEFVGVGADGTGINVTRTKKDGTIETVSNSDYELTVNPDTKQVSIRWLKMLEDGVTYTIRFQIKPSQAAIETYIRNGGQYNQGEIGETNTGSTSAEQPGFYSNTTATLTYNGDGNDQKIDYSKPVIQIQTTTIPVEKIWDNRGNTAHRSDSITAELYYKESESPYKSVTLNEANGWKNKFTNIPVGSEDKFIVKENMTDDQSSYYESTITGDGKTGFTITNTLKVTSFTIQKVDENTKDPLADARFELVKADENWDPIDQEHPVATEATGSDGKATFNDIPFGNYLLYETKAPAGYKLPKDPVRITVADGKVTYYMAGNNEGQTVDIINLAVTVSVPNIKQDELPVAGGMGAIWFSAGGLALASAAALLYFKQRKKGEE